jgi:hypothetical protein
MRVALLAALGYAYLSVAATLLAAVFGMAAAHFLGHTSGLLMEAGIVILAIAWTLVWWARLEFHPPDGYALPRKDAPDLFAMIDRTTAALKAPTVHQVVLTGEFNASIAHIPRLGAGVNILVVGLPLMEALSPDQFRAVLAHELAHLSGHHGRFSSRIYRIRQVWITVLENLDQPTSGGGFVFGGFLRWYAPYFSAYSFVLARSDEYVADRVAAEVVGARTLATALIATRIKARFVEKSFWPELYNKASDAPDPPTAPHEEMFHVLPSEPQKIDAERWLEEALAEETTLADTHPSLASRLAALGFDTARTNSIEGNAGSAALPVPLPLTETAGGRYLGETAAALTRQFDADWRVQIAASWEEMHAEAKEARGRVEHMREEADRGLLPVDEMWVLFQLISDYCGEDAGATILESILAQRPNEPRANYALGQILLKQDQARGVILLDKAMAHEPDCTIPACESIYYFFKRTNKLYEAAAYRRRSDAHREMLDEAQEERATLSTNDVYVSHGLGTEQVQNLREQLARHPGVREAYLVRKQCRLLADRPFYVLGIYARRSAGSSGRTTEHLEMAETLATDVTVPGEARLVLLAGRYKHLGRQLEGVPDALIYRG